MIQKRDVPEPLSETPSLNPKNSAPLRGFEILVVDDSDENRYLFEHLLVRKGANVFLARDGLEALDLAKKKTFDVILMDIQMPKMDGHGAIKKLLDSGYVKPIVALTASSTVDERNKISTSGFTAQMTKPIDKESLVNLIREIAGKGNPSDQIDRP